jgi:hypothetical protein
MGRTVTPVATIVARLILSSIVVTFTAARVTQATQETPVSP